MVSPMLAALHCPNASLNSCMGMDWNGTNTSEIGPCYPMSIVIPDLIDRLYIRILLGACYILIWILGVGGNSLVLYLVLWRKLDFSVRTVFIVSLSFSDIIMALTSLPVTAISTFTRAWLLPDFLCYGIGLLQASSVFVSSFTLIMIAVDRYYLICHPHVVKFTYQRAILAVIIFWLIGVTLATPMSIFMKMEDLEPAGVCGFGCMEEWPAEIQPAGKRIYGSAVFIIQYGFPIVLCSVLYVEIGWQLGEQFERRRRTQIVTEEMAERSIQRRRRTNRMMIGMVACFVLTWLPFNVVNLVRDFDLFEYIFPIQYFVLSFAFSHILGMLSIVANPLLYCFFNPKFRSSVREILAGHTKNSNANMRDLKTKNTTWL